ncbi:hypothetical protein GCM10027435_16370 [Haloparvum alkalitolerans]|uniref:hypothetical protein n=1 Tax=Haloparvum alkalitolerans TaxID=1042953 RepID=UPI003CF07DFA
MRRLLTVLALVSIVALAGCAGLPGAGDAGEGTAVPDEEVSVANDEANATGVNQTLRLTVNESVAGDELTSVGATYPRDRFNVDEAAHDAILIGVDTDGDGDLDRGFNETHVSGVNTNEFSYDVTLDTDYTLKEGDTVVLGYPAVDNPEEAGEYAVEVHVNDEQRANGTVVIEDAE